MIVLWILPALLIVLLLALLAAVIRTLRIPKKTSGSSSPWCIKGLKKPRSTGTCCISGRENPLKSPWC